MMIDKKTVEEILVDEIHYLVDMDFNEEAETRLIEYANKRVIEELEKLLTTVEDYNGNMAVHQVEIMERINKLKQD